MSVATPTPAAARTATSTSLLLTQGSALLWGTQFAFLNPAIGIILVSLYGASPAQVGLALAAYNTSGFVSTLVVPTRADRRGDYLRPLLWCGAFTIALTTALALATTLPWAVLALVALGGPAGVGIGLLFAYQRHAGATTSQIMRTRAMFSFAWVGGPPLAAFLMGFFGSRSILWAVAGIGVVGLGLTQVMRREHVRSGGARWGAPTGERMTVALRRPDVVLLLVTFVALGAALSAQVSALPLYVTEGLGLDVEWSGIALGTCAALEIPVLVALGRLTGRFGPRRVVAAGCVSGVAYFVLMALAGSQVVLVAGQALNAFFIATMSGVGLTIFQDVLERPGLASALFMNTTRVGAIVAGPVVAVAGIGALGYAGVFGACAVLVAAGLGLLVLGYVRRVRSATSRSLAT